MILLITPARRAQECASAVENATGHKTAVAESLVQAMTLLRTTEYVLVLLDQHLLEVEPNEIETVRAHLGTAVELEMNLVINGIERVVGAVRSALARREREEDNARVAAAQALHSELGDSLSRLLAECDLASAVLGVPPSVTEKLAVVRAEVQKVCTRLAAHQSAPA